ncbi:MAG TPA: CHAT domain-containing protein [Vicinamibacterales bacterium]
MIPGDALPGDLQRGAMYWTYALRSRQRWAGAELTQPSPVDTLLDPAALARIAEAQLVEVDVPFSGEQEHWELRVMPWEALLARATKPYRGERPLTVVRRLRRPGPAAPIRPVIQTPLIVESAPAGLERFYDVKGEGDLMIASLGLQADAVARLQNPSADDLRREVEARQPTLIHLAGVDSHEAQELLGLQQPRGEADDEEEATRLDGMALRGTAKRPALVSAGTLAALLTPQPPHAELAVFNFYNSAARMAPLAVARGVRCAIGYQDVIDPSLAAAFCTTFYRSLREPGSTMLEAFTRALETLRGLPQPLQGAGIVLWSADPLVGVKPRPAAARAPATGRRPVTASLKPAESVPPDQQLSVVAEAHASINYSLLHNRRSPFKSLRLVRRDVTGPIGPIRVKAVLYVGEASFPCRMTLTLPADQNLLDIADRVVVPLTSAVLRTQGEGIQSSLFLQVRCRDTVVYSDTNRVLLSPVDQWTDDDENRWWLPSFVLPRDPSVATVIDQAQRYLMAMADDPAAGFDGYQSVVPGQDENGPVDLQARAIWSALLYDHALRYVNPPPTYATMQQRLRTPADVLQGHRGTCIDLALLLAACLEYVDIYPVIFLLKGHAFPGYWRSAAYHDEFRLVKDPPLPVTASPDALRASERTTARFEDAYALKNFYEARDLVARGRLVPLETVWLTNHGSFADAVEEGRKNLRQAAEFDSMLDITLARRRGITPLPILWRPE